MSGNGRPLVAIVILNWNTRELLERYLPSVVATTYEPVDIWVVDNASTDDSVAFVQANYPQIKVMVSDENRGYAGGYNWALKQIEADHYILLNSDVQVTPHWVEPLIERVTSDPSVAAIQPKIKDDKDHNRFEYAGACGGFMDRWGYAFCRGRIFDKLEIDEGQYNEAMPVFWATGACLFVNAKAYREVGGLDEDFFAHMEEIDLCWRLQLSGYKVYVEPASEVFHLGGGTLSEGSERKFFLNFRNNLMLLVKNDHDTGWWLRLLGRMVLDGVSAFKFIVDGKPRLFGVVLRAHGAFWSSLSTTLAKRKIWSTKVRSKVDRYPRSIVWQHFIKGVDRFSDL